MILSALASDPRFKELSGGKQIALESICRDIESILNGDDNFPSLWWHMADKARIAAGIAPLHSWMEDV